MIYGPAFYKLLGIPESVAEPTAYHLLALDPRMITENMVDEALAARKASLRRIWDGPGAQQDFLTHTPQEPAWKLPER